MERMGGGIFGAHKVAAEDDTHWVIKPTKYEFPSSTGSPHHWGLRGVCTEFIAAGLAKKLGLAVPEHTKLYLHQAIIDSYPELNDFKEGYVIAIEYHEGYDLDFLEKNPQMMNIVKSGINNLSNSHMALGIIFTDTLFSNADRYSRFLHGGRKVSGNKGNLFFTKILGSSDLYNITAIDFGLSFSGCTWGASVAPDWPRQIFGMMRFFYKMGWLPEKFADAEPIFDQWLGYLGAINIGNEIDIIMKDMPSEWHISSDPLLVLNASDFDDLKARITKHASLTKAIVSSQYVPSYATVKR